MQAHVLFVRTRRVIIILERAVTSIHTFVMTNRDRQDSGGDVRRYFPWMLPEKKRCLFLRALQVFMTRRSCFFHYNKWGLVRIFTPLIVRQVEIV